MQKAIKKLDLDKEISYFSNVKKSLNPTNFLTIKEVLSLIKTNKKLEEITQKIRNSKEDIYRKQLKSLLPLVTFSGKFSARNIKGLDSASGVAVIDLDSFGNIEEIKRIKNDVKKLSFVLFAFISPSGGLKIGCKIPTVKNDFEYKQYYIPLSKEFDKYNHLLTKKNDSATKDISRLCFLSYDEELYINESAIEYTKKDIDIQNQNNNTSIQNSNTGILDDTRFDRSQIEFNEVIKLLKKDWTKDKIFEYMDSNFEKWKTSPEQYKNLTYNKAYQSYLDIKKEKEPKRVKIKREDYSDIKTLRDKVYKSILEGDKNTASEFLTKYFESKNKIYSIRNDEKREIWVYDNGVFKPNGISKIKEFIRDIVIIKYSTHFSNQVVEKVEVDNFIDAAEFFNSETKNEICVLNGVLNVLTKELTPFTPDKIFFNKIPVHYDSSKKINKALSFIKDIVATKDDVDIIQELFGYCLYKTYSIEKALMFTGSGRKGKSQLLALLKNFVGVENTSALTLEDLNGRFDIISLHKKLVNIAGDINNTVVKETGLFKKLTGKDSVDADRKFQTKLSFVNYAKFLFAANDLPNFLDGSDGFWDRWILIDFPYRFEYKEKWDRWKELKEQNLLKERKNDVIEEIINNSEEMSGLLTWALDGLERLLNKEHFTENKFSKDIKKIWERKANSFKAFVSEYLEEGSFEDYIIKTELKKKYLAYCKTHGAKNTQSDSQIKYTLQNEFAVESTKKVIKDSDLFDEASRAHVWTGIKWKK